MKGSLGLRPVFHHREDRIRSHIQLCWLALLLIRVVENGTGDTWRNVRHELDRMHLVTMENSDGRVSQRTTTTAGQAEILAKLDSATYLTTIVNGVCVFSVPTLRASVVSSTNTAEPHNRLHTGIDEWPELTIDRSR